MRRRVPLARLPVEQREGRVDWALYEFANRMLKRLETEQGLVGICDNFLPLVEQAIAANLPARNLIPRELSALLKVWMANRRGQT